MLCVVITFTKVRSLRYFRPYGIIFVPCVVVTVAMVMLLRDLRPHGIILMFCYSCYHGNVCSGPYHYLFTVLAFPVILNGKYINI
jgi:hypothetical protein